MPATAARVEPLKLDDCGLPAHWAAPYACDLKHHAIMQGDDSGFRFDDVVTRAEFVTLTARALGLTPQQGPSFSDVQGHWAAGYIKAAVDAGVLTADAGASFRPDAAIARQDAIKLLAGVLAGPKLNDADERVLAGYSDAAQIDPAGRKAVAFALLHSVIQGDTDKAIHPAQSLTRGEAAKIIAVAVPERLLQGVDKLSLVLYNDLHGHLMQDKRQRPGQDVGVALLTTAINGQFLKNPNAILIDGGDTYQGTPISNLVNGQSTLEWRNQVGVRVAAIGNHEFDWKIDTLKKLIADSKQPVITANVFVEGTDSRPDWAVPTTMVELNGYKLGFIGITTPATKTIVVAANVEGLEFRDPAPVINKEAARLRQEGADLVVVVAHAAADPGTPDPFAITNEVAEFMKRVTARVDVVTGAHSHREAAGYVLDAAGNTVPVVQAGSYSRALGRVDLYISRSDRSVIRAVPVEWQPAQTLAPTPWVTEMLDKWAAQVKPIESRPVGKLARPLTRKNTQAGESELGDFIADSMLTAGQGTQIALMNGGGIRADLEGEAGDVNWGHLYTVQPFGNTLVTVPLTGTELKTLLEQGLESYVKSVRNQPGGHGPMQVAGITFTWDFAKAQGERIDVATLKLADGKPVDMTATYKVVVNNFMADGGDDLAQLKSVKAKQIDLGVIDLDLFVDYFKAKSAVGPVDYSLQNRITVTNYPAK